MTHSTQRTPLHFRPMCCETQAEVPCQFHYSRWQKMPLLLHWAKFQQVQVEEKNFWMVLLWECTSGRKRQLLLLPCYHTGDILIWSHFCSFLLARQLIHEIFEGKWGIYFKFLFNFSLTRQVQNSISQLPSLACIIILKFHQQFYLNSRIFMEQFALPNEMKEKSIEKAEIRRE